MWHQHKYFKFYTVKLNNYYQGSINYLGVQSIGGHGLNKGTNNSQGNTVTLMYLVCSVWTKPGRE